MNPLIDSLNAFSAAWSTWLWRASWQAAIVVAVAWLLCTLFARSSAWLRSWIWRLAYVKLLLLLVWTSPINVPLLPATEQTEIAATANHENSSPFQGEGGEKVEALTTPATTTPPIDDRNAAAGIVTTTAELPVTSTAPALETVTSSATLSAIAWLFVLWSLGALLVVAWFAIETRRAFTLYRSARRIKTTQLTALVASVCNQLSLNQTIELAESPLASGPMLVKFRRPLIVFPRGMLSIQIEPFSPSPSTGEGRGEGEAQPCDKNAPNDSEAPCLTHDEIRLVLAHELAHLKRHDLSWNALAALLNALLYFHPFIWIAHRSARQEQEMACDELVVTRLGVERHEYGQLLVKIVRQVGRQMNGAVATVGMSNSYQTVSRRISAMQQFRKLSRRETLVAASLLTFAASLALVPWQLVAQEAKWVAETPAAATAAHAQGEAPAVRAENPRFPASAAALAIGETAAASPAADWPAASNDQFHPAALPFPFGAQSPEDPQDGARRKLIVGTWRDQAGNKLIFFDDGTYDDLGVEIFVRQLQQRQGYPARIERLRGQGDWSIRDGDVHLTNDASQRYWDKDAKSLGQSDRPQECAFAIRRLDDNLLRLTFQGIATATYFLRRVNEKSADEKFSAIPAELRAFFDVAQFTPEEATTLLQYFDRYKDAVAPLQVAARLQQAQLRKITLRELFGMTPEEVSAFQELLDEHTGSKETLAELAKGGQLSGIEQSAFGKTEPITKAFEQLAETRPGVWGHGSPPNKATQFLRLFPVKQFSSSDRRVIGDEQTALDKLYVYLYDLEQWYRSVVFQNHR